MTVITQPPPTGIFFSFLIALGPYGQNFTQLLHSGFLQEYCDIINYLPTSVSIKWEQIHMAKSSSEDAGTLHTLRTTAAQCYRETYA
jgi:hypothetical protein